MLEKLNEATDYKEYFPNEEIRDYFMKRLFGSVTRSLIDQ